MKLVLKKSKKLFILASCLLITTTIFNLQQNNAYATTNDSISYKIDTISEFKEDFINKDEATKKQVLEETNPQVIEKYIQQKTEELNNVSSKIDGIRNDEDAQKVENNNKNISSVSYNETYSKKDDKSIITIKADLKDEGSIELELIDQKEDTELSDSLTAAIVNKEYGNRYFVGKKSISVGKLWPKAVVKCKLGYHVYKNKNVTRNYTYAKNQCEGDKWVRAGFKTKIIKARVTSKGVSKNVSNGQKYAWSKAQYRIMTYNVLTGREHWGYTANMYIVACPTKFYNKTADISQEFTTRSITQD